MQPVIRICVLTVMTVLLGDWVTVSATDPVKQPKTIKPLKFPLTSEPHFRTSDRCFACHNGLLSPTGEDISSRDPYWQAGIRRETLDHPESKALIEDECSKCHMPMARYEAMLHGKEGTVFDHFPLNDYTELAADGVSRLSR